MNEPADTTSPYTPPVSDPSVPAATATGPEATLGQRIGAYLIDFLVGIGFYVAAGIIGAIFGFVLGDTIGGIIGGLLGLVGILASIAYFLLKDSLPFLNGQSIGKKALKIKAVTETGQSLSGNWGPGLIRNAVLFIPFFPLVELIIMIQAQGKPEGLRRLGDQWAKTKVVPV